MKNTRSFVRFDKYMKDQYFLKEKNRDWEECTVFKISRKGMGLKFYTSEKIKVGSTIQLKIFTSKESEKIIVKGVLKWIEEEENNFLGGIELNEILDESKWITLIHFIDNPLEERTKKMRSISPLRQVGKSSRPSPPQKVI
ncbi:MAG: PilZ domain-containing protein [Deltaproteobacteria bacterium]|nr:PilZ domain-containing protein [Deltaproteobacteria bacterium]